MVDGLQVGVRCGSRARRVAVLMAVLLCAAVLGACGGAGSDSSGGEIEKGNWGAAINTGGDPVSGGTLKIGTQNDPTGVSPVFFNLETPDQQAVKIIMQVFDQLVELRSGSLEPQPGIAKSWDVSTDGLTYTFELRQAKFSNGTPVTAADVKYTLDYIRAPGAFFAELFEPISQVQTPDPQTVVVKLSQPTPALLEYLAFPGASIVPGKLIEDIGVDEYNKAPIGSGPFVIEHWRRDQEVALRRNDNYWRDGLPYLDKVTLLTMPDDNARVLNVQSGTVDVADAIPFPQIPEINESGVAEVLVAPAAETWAVNMNNSATPYDEVEIRRAVNYATPVDSIIDVVFGGEVEKANTQLPKLKYWTSASKAYPFDLEKAEEELKKSSVPDGFSTSIMIDPESQAARQVALILQETWKKIGINLKIEQPEASVQEEAYFTGTYKLLLGPPGVALSDVPVEDEFAKLLFDSPETNNLFTFSGETAATPLTRQALKETDEKRRAALFEKMHIASMEDPENIAIAYIPSRAAVANNVRNFAYLLCGWYLLDEAWMEG